MNKFVTENLLLLEFLVEDISLTEVIKKKIECLQGITNVEFRFLNNNPIVISAEDMQVSCVNGKATRSGKSCLFSLSTEQGIEALGNFLIKLRVYQTLPPCMQPNTIDIADGEICISELFQDLMESAMNSSQKAWVKCQKEVVKLYRKGEGVGILSCYIRMSCYGKYIVTQCEMSVSDFKGKQPPITEVIQQDGNERGESCKPQCPAIPFQIPGPNNSMKQGGDCVCDMPPQPPCTLKSKAIIDSITPPVICGCSPPPNPIELIPKPYTAYQKPAIKKPSKDKLVLRLTMPEYAADKCDPTKPYEFEFVTPAAWPRQTLGKQCIDTVVDCRDYPKGYLIDFYGEGKLAQMLYNQMKEEERREKLFGEYPVGQFAPDPAIKVEPPKKGKGKGKKGKGKKEKKKSYAQKLYECLGVVDLMKKIEDFYAHGGKGSFEEQFGKGKGGKGGRGGRGGGAGGEGSEDGDGTNEKGTQLHKRRKLRPTCGILVLVPDKAFPPPCPPCWCRPCGPCDPCAPCKPCGPCRPCKPCIPCKPCKPCGPCKPCRPCDPCDPCGPCKPCRPCDPCDPCGPCGPCKPCPPSRCGSVSPSARTGDSCNPCKFVCPTNVGTCNGGSRRTITIGGVSYC